MRLNGVAHPFWKRRLFFACDHRRRPTQGLSIDANQMERGDIRVLQDDAAERIAADFAAGMVAEWQGGNRFEQDTQLLKRGALVGNSGLSPRDERSLAKLSVVNCVDVLRDPGREAKREQRRSNPQCDARSQSRRKILRYADPA